MDKFIREKFRLIAVNRILVKGRWLYTSGIVLIGLASKITGNLSERIADSPNTNFPLLLMVFMGLCSYGLNLIFFFYFRKPERISFAGVRIISFFNLIIDYLFYILVIFYAGGLTSISFLYFFYNIIASAFFYSFAGVLIISSLASIFYGGLILLQYFEIIPFFSRYNLAYEYALAFNYSAVITNLIAIILSFYIVGMFAGLIARALRAREEEIREERDKERAILANLSDGLVFVNRRGIIEAVNAKAEKFLDFAAKEVLGKKAKNIDKRYINLLEIFKDKYKKKGELKPAGMGEEVLRIYTVTIIDEKGELIGTAKIIHDISREKFVDRMKSEFIMIAGHQLRTPLSAIKSAFDLLLKGNFGKMELKQKKVLEQCFDYNEKLIKMVDDLLDIFSIEQGKYYYQFVKTDLGGLLEEVSKRYQETAAEKGVKFNLNIDKNLPEAKLDPNKVKLVLASLIENAVIYTDKGGEVTVDCRLKDDKILLAVKDTGIGISKESQSQIFTKFFRGANALSFQPEGNGLGLFVAKNIVEYHEGKIWFTSEVDKGTTFYVELPLDPLTYHKEKKKVS
ncbi:MAG: ATP-binding protein [Patescibacteria group bacterium]|nr:ATP-binding protein [Patescibacteria group bacterium]MDD5294963.1 ATP-binding protein [Patescibacteria group bacterium]MDD5554590.1 ATP-binding protein [Patescibacteria group bacterium]